MDDEDDEEAGEGDEEENDYGGNHFDGGDGDGDDALDGGGDDGESFYPFVLPRSLCSLLVDADSLNHMFRRR